MIAIEQTVAVLLCAGLSRRFGEGDKLLEPFRGKPLALHAAERLAALPFQDRLAVVPRGGRLGAMLAAHGFALVENDRPQAGQDVSARLGIERALELDPRAIMICLGDMPDITGDHLRALAGRADDRTAAMSWAGTWASPPTIAPVAAARRILEQPNRPVKQILIEGELAYCPASAETLADLDTPADFAARASAP